MNTGKENNVFIGRKIKTVLRIRNMKVKQLAEELGISESPAFRILRRRHINTLLLMKISAILKHDFFQYFQPAPDLPGRHKLEKEKLKEQLRQLRKENALLRKMAGQYPPN